MMKNTILKNGTPAVLALEDGRIFACRSFTGHGEAAGEIVFNTSMTGYQEILTDPSYCGQMVTMTYPLIGNYGVAPEDMESDQIHAQALLVKEYQPEPSNHRSAETLAGFLRRHGIMGIEALDTRALTLHIRKSGAMRAFVSTLEFDPQTCVNRARAIPTMQGRNLTGAASTVTPYRWQGGQKNLLSLTDLSLDECVWQFKGNRPYVVAFDFGIKHNILRSLEATGFEVIVIPAATDAKTVRAIAPDGIFLSNGPGDPEPAVAAVNTIKDLIGFRPMFGICLGHQLMALALGGKTYKLKFGHHGGNQPVINVATGKVDITSQNHGFAVDAESLNQSDIEITHLNLNDRTVEGFRHRRWPLFAVQYHPEAAPGPHDSGYLFSEFKNMITAFCNEKESFYVQNN
ncbi:MAG: glutamine-hydrolyzing carbamoyl-phosphate synthase small subunit [Smithellaceae bacterium]|nr:glutamine-hydrolyzing carbamoyl-phosphate synthase small subunit [Smithellaceae bacterium]